MQITISGIIWMYVSAYQHGVGEYREVSNRTPAGLAKLVSKIGVEIGNDNPILCSAIHYPYFKEIVLPRYRREREARKSLRAKP